MRLSFLHWCCQKAAWPQKYDPVGAGAAKLGMTLREDALFRGKDLEKANSGFRGFGDLSLRRIPRTHLHWAGSRAQAPPRLAGPGPGQGREAGAGLPPAAGAWAQGFPSGS